MFDSLKKEHAQRVENHAFSIPNLALKLRDKLDDFQSVLNQSNSLNMF